MCRLRLYCCDCGATRYARSSMYRACIESSTTPVRMLLLLGVNCLQQRTQLIQNHCSCSCYRSTIADDLSNLVPDLRGDSMALTRIARRRVKKRLPMASKARSTKNVLSSTPWTWNNGQDAHAALHPPCWAIKGKPFVLATSSEKLPSLAA